MARNEKDLAIQAVTSSLKRLAGIRKIDGFVANECPRWTERVGKILAHLPTKALNDLEWEIEQLRAGEPK